ncbi:DUF29 domain-containing protein [Planktothrix agardhii]|uniref:DUF29 domain-containing protein n=1 Tax=Planktothrix agardhii TaxID=1160 RepID=UPI000DBB0F1F|nr:DUF29 domain-containing protein [Planktothrix agardhii]MCB8758810.1 DUF29 domain-containing protein [Planktothrix agardhii 1813]BBD55789.1 hypothetical protein NIES204_31060 [Planktothrix agardhii NIES-204]
MRTSEDWEWLAASSEYLAAIAIQELLEEQKFMEAGSGLAVLIESMGKSKKLALKSQLTRLIMHIIKWKCQPEKRTSSWETTIIYARDEIADIQEEVPSLNRNYLESIWETSVKKAIRQAESEMGKRCQLTALSWQELFEDEYSLFDYN